SAAQRLRLPYGGPGGEPQGSPATAPQAPGTPTRLGRLLDWRRGGGVRTEPLEHLMVITTLTSPPNPAWSRRHRWRPGTHDENEPFGGMRMRALACLAAGSPLGKTELIATASASLRGRIGVVARKRGQSRAGVWLMIMAR